MGRYLITSALPYINGIKHLGNLAGSMLPSDVHARFRRLQGHEVLLICATDEHGTPAELAAMEAGHSVGDYCHEQHVIQKQLYEQFDLSFDYFGRSSSKENRELTQMFADRLEDNNLIEERVERQMFSSADNRFLPDRYIEGTCPECGYENARGDQCDSCGKLLEPTDLLKPRSAVSGSYDLEVRETAHLFLLQSKMVGPLEDWIDRSREWSSLAKSIALKWLKEGVQDRSITRDLVWGVPVLRHGAVRSGFENKVFYVWFDAPIEYIAATVEWSHNGGGDWQRWWKTDKGADDVCYVQFMGKDNVAFHSVNFPITMLGLDEPWKMVNKIKAFSWLNWYGEKFSTSQKRGVFMDTALELFPSDYWRWYLTANAPEASDGSFSWEEFQVAINSDLANVLGNFVNRTTSFVGARFASVIPDAGEHPTPDPWLQERVTDQMEKIIKAHETMEFKKLAAETRALWALGNEYLARTEPWSKIKVSRDEAATIIYWALNLCYLFAVVAYPIIPSSAERIFEMLGCKVATPLAEVLAEDKDWLHCGTSALQVGRKIAVGEPLFKKIEDDDKVALIERFPPKS
ncbi:MAG: methionine--tRNA ligase [Parvularculales bacterium]